MPRCSAASVCGICWASRNPYFGSSGWNHRVKAFSSLFIPALSRKETLKRFVLMNKAHSSPDIWLFLTCVFPAPEIPVSEISRCPPVTPPNTSGSGRLADGCGMWLAHASLPAVQEGEIRRRHRKWAGCLWVSWTFVRNFQCKAHYEQFNAL